MVVILCMIFQGVVTAAVSLIETLAKKNPDEYKGCVSLAVSRLSRVSSVLLFTVTVYGFTVCMFLKSLQL